MGSRNRHGSSRLSRESPKVDCLPVLREKYLKQSWYVMADFSTRQGLQKKQEQATMWQRKGKVKGLGFARNRVGEYGTYPWAILARGTRENRETASNGGFSFV